MPHQIRLERMSPKVQYNASSGTPNAGASHALRQRKLRLSVPASVACKMRRKITLATLEERAFRCRSVWLSPLIGVPMLAFYCTFGDILSNLIWCGMMIWLSYCAIRGLAYAKTQTGAARNMRYFHIGVLCFAFAEYLLWTAGCFWPNTSPESPTFWCDMLLTLAIFGLLPATRKAVEA